MNPINGIARKLTSDDHGALVTWGWLVHFQPFLSPDVTDA